MANEVNVEITGQENVSDAVNNVADSSQQASRVVVNSMGSTEEAFDTAARASGRWGSALDTASGAVDQLSGGLGDISGAFDAFKDLQNFSANKAHELARAQNDVEQAMADTEQAAIDYKQAQLDLNQSVVDGRQFALDSKQAEADKAQALIDARTAQEDYNAAVKEYGPNSIEAAQAAQDLKQANLDLEQADIDAAQAIADSNQAKEDAKQASADMTQANIDAKGSALDLTEAQKAALPPTQLQEWSDKAALLSPLLMGVVGATSLLQMANMALNASFIKTAATAVASRTAIIATSVASGIATAAQWAWNVAMMANPIGLIIAGVMLLIGVIVLIATKTTWFQDLWSAVWSFMEKPVKWLVDMVVGYVTFMWGMWSNVIGAIRDFFVASFKWAIDFIVGYFGFIWSLPGKFWNVFKSIGDAIWQPLKWAFNMVAWAWNNTVGRLSFRIPDWVPGVGGNGFSMPRLPMLASGGDITRTGMAIVHKGERIVPAGHAGLGASGGGGVITVVIDMSSVPAEIRTWIKKMTRVYGGTSKDNVQIAWG